MQDGNNNGIKINTKYVVNRFMWKMKGVFALCVKNVNKSSCLNEVRKIDEWTQKLVLNHTINWVPDVIIGRKQLVLKELKKHFLSMIVNNQKYFFIKSFP